MLGSPAGAVSGALPAFAIDTPYRAAMGEAETPCNTSENRIVQVAVCTTVVAALLCSILDGDEREHDRS